MLFMTAAERLRATYAFQTVYHLIRREYYITPNNNRKMET